MRIRQSRRVLAIVISALCIVGVVLAIVWVLPAYAANPPRLGHLSPTAGRGTPSQRGIISRSTASISLSKNSYPPTALLEVSGSGFGAGEDVDIYFDKADLALAKSDGGGNFSGIVIQVPASAVPGTHWVTATGRSSGQSAQAPFLVSTNWNQFGFSPAHQAFNPYENLLGPSNVGQLQLAWTTPQFGISSGSPAIAGGSAYFSTLFANQIFGINQYTGKLNWRATSADSYSSDIALNYLPINGTLSWVLFVGTFNSDQETGAVTAYDVSACRAVPCPLLWSEQASGYVEVTYAFGAVYASSFDGHTSAYDAATGTPLWTSGATTSMPSQPRGSVAGDFTSAPAVANGIVYAGSHTGLLYALNAANGALEWTGRLGNAASDTPMVAAGIVYIETQPGILEAFKASGCGVATCEPVWTADVGSTLISDPAYTNGVVYVGPSNGDVYAYAAAGCGNSTCGPLWIGTTVSGWWSDLSAANGVVYASSGFIGGQLTAFNAAGCGSATCAPLWTYTFPRGDGENGTAPVISNGTLYVVSESGALYAFGLPATMIAPLPARPNPASLRPNLALRLAMPRLTPLPDLPDQ